ncbi:MAG TPA: hypothetical protein VL882_22020 [Vicinamibacterales bacterium]|jgi:hypothetical protein|nr:hypothetical protein [Vicinamibacterales bacterium]
MIGHPAVKESVDRRLFDRRMFLVAAILFPLLVLAGFARTYYLRGLFDVPPLPSLVVHLHGLMMTAWVLLFVTQVWLISSKRVRVHQRLGYTGIWLAALILPVGFVTAARAAKYGSPSTPPGVSQLGFMIVPLFDLVMFTIFFGAAIYLRKRPTEHKRLMLLTAINFIPPAIARIPIASLQAAGPLWFFGFPTALALVCLGLDTWRYGKMNRVFVVGIALLVASYVARLALMPSAAWLAMAQWLTSFV